MLLQGLSCCQCFTFFRPSLKSHPIGYHSSSVSRVSHDDVPNRHFSKALFYRNEGEDKGKDLPVSPSDLDVKVDSSILQKGTNDTIGFVGDDPDAAIICERKLDYVGAGTLGDIMSDPSQDECSDVPENTPQVHIGQKTTSTKNNIEKGKNGVKPMKSGLVTSTGGTLTAQYGLKVPGMSPLDRILLTANGNLQRIFSSFYDAPVHVHVDRCVKRRDSSARGNVDITKCEEEAIWDRVVHLSVFDTMFCKATSVITVHSNDCIKIVESGEVGIGQLFRYLDKLPTFTILDAGRCENGGIWRQYKLECKELTCDILEEFIPNAWEIKSDAIAYFNELDNTF